jgi:hypothetical protein
MDQAAELPYEHVLCEGRYCMNTFEKSGILVLPTNPEHRFKIVIWDRFGSWSAHPLIVHRNGSQIGGIDEHLFCDEPLQAFVLEFLKPARNWLVHQNFFGEV